MGLGAAAARRHKQAAQGGPKAPPEKAAQDKPGRVEVRASGGWGSGFDVDATATLAGAALAARGRYAPTARGDDARLFGALKISGDNAAPLTALVGVAAVSGAIGPVEASADVTLRERAGPSRASRPLSRGPRRAER